MLRVLRHIQPLALLVGGCALFAADVAPGVAFAMVMAAILFFALAITDAPKDRQGDHPSGDPVVSSADETPRARIVVFDSLDDALWASAGDAADLVVLRCRDGTWTVSKDRDGAALAPRPWDELPARLKDAIGAVML